MRILAILVVLASFALAQEQEDVFNVSTVSETFGLFTAGFEQVTAEAAVRNIEGWQARLEATGDENLASLSEDLGAFAEALQASPEGAAIAEQLVNLGERTGEIAANVGDEDVARRLTTLAYVLQEAGRTVQEDPQAELSNVVPVVPPILGRTAQFLQGDLADASLAAALLNIEAWQGRILTNVESDAGTQLVNDLERLQDALQMQEVDQAGLGEIFGALAQDTRAVAETVDPALQNALTSFAGLLENAGGQGAN